MNFQDNPLIQADMQRQQQQPQSQQEQLPSRDQLTQLAKDGKLTHMGGKLPDFLKGVIPEAKDKLKQVEKSKGGIIGDVTVSGETLDVLAGTKKLDAVSDRPVVDSDLDKLGFNTDATPEWFKTAATDQGMPPEQIDSSWTTARKEILGTQTQQSQPLTPAQPATSAQPMNLGTPVQPTQ